MDVDVGSASSLHVTYGPPLSDGGSPVLAYRVELDVSNMFTNPIHTLFPCPTDNAKSVFAITSSGFGVQGVDLDPIVGGSFVLSVSRNGSTFTSDPVPYDAVAMAADEVGELVAVADGSVTASFDLFLYPSTFITNAPDVTPVIFPGDRLQFKQTRFPAQTYVVTRVDSQFPNRVHLNSTILLPIGVQSLSRVAIYRLIGGRGLDANSRVACTPDTRLSSICPDTRLTFSGSMQSKLQDIPEALMNGVVVSRDGPDTTNGCELECI